MEIFGIALTIISLILAYQAWQNGKLMKQMHVESMAMIKSIKELNEAIKEDIRISTQETRALLERMEKSSEEMRKLFDERMERSSEATRILIERTTQETRALLERMEKSSEETRALLERMEKSSEETKTLLERIQKGQEEARKEMASAIKYIAELIVADGERTRELLRAKGRV